MAVKKCCIKTCKSCSTRKEDSGVTYHKFPKDDALRKTWILVTHSNDSVSYNYVCSRHFYKSDFQVNKESKYILKSEAVPAIFPWSITKCREMENIADFETITSQESTEKMTDSHENEANMSGSSKESDENVDAIKKFIEDQTKEIEDQKLAANKVLAAVYEINDGDIKTTNNQKDQSIMASNVMDMILSDSEKLTQKKDIKEIPQQNLNMDEKLNSSMSLSVGSRVEAKDFSEDWHIAEIVEVDYDEMEVLIQYDQNTKKHNEWINVSSPRLRPIGSIPAKPVTIQRDIIPEPVAIKTHDNEGKVEKAEDKAVVSFDIGERCLARWRDNRRFMATVHNDLGNGTYEIIFDDGFHWKCSKSRLYKWKPTKVGTLTVDTSLNSPTSSTHSPIQSGGPSNSITHSPQPVFHTHLFDPARDYLGSKSERREMKRKLNIKEIFNIGQKRSKLRKVDRDKTKPVVEKKPRVGKKSSKAKVETVVKKEIDVDMKRKIPDAVASIIGTVQKDVLQSSEIKFENITETEEKSKEDTAIEDNVEEIEPCTTINDTIHPDESALSEGVKSDSDPVLEEEVKLENFEKQDEIKHVEVIDKMKEVINKLEDGLKNDIVCSPKPEIKEEIAVVKEEFKVEIKEEIIEINEKFKDKPEECNPKVDTDSEKLNKLSKIKKGKKLRLLREKKVKKQVEKVKNELEEMKKQVDEMRKQMLMKTQELTKAHTEMPESFLLPGEWCCRWVNGQPLGTVSEIVCEVKLHSDGRPALPRRSVQVEDKRLPPGWTKHMVRRSLGHSAGKWDVVLVSPENRRFHTKTDMRIYLENNPDKSLQLYEYALTDFGVHLKLARRMGWISNTPGGVADGPTQPINALSITSPLIKKKKQLSLSKQRKIERKKKFMLHFKKSNPLQPYMINTKEEEVRATTSKETELTTETPLDVPPLEDGYVYVGSLKVQIIDNLLRCPADGCLKNFRNNTLLQMHIKHYHRELREMLGSTPKVLDLAYARTMPTDAEIPRNVDSKVLKVKINRLPKREDQKSESRVNSDLLDVEPTTPICNEPDSIPRTQDSPKLRDALVNKPVKRPKVLLPVRRPEPEQCLPEDIESLDNIDDVESPVDIPTVEQLDFETAICTHTVTKPNDEKKRSLKKLKSFAVVTQRQSEEEEWFAGNSDYESRSSYPRSGTPDSKVLERQLTQYIPEMNSRPKQRDNASYMYTETGERIKLVRMKREEIINCHCGFREEDGLMVQCELCLCWQHALCHNIHNESQVPEKYTCSICVNPRRGRRSMRFLHDQDRLYEGLLPGAKPCDSLRRSHELSGNLLLLRDALHALRVKTYVAMKKNHPKLYLWAQDWEQAEITSTQEKLNSGYSDLTIVPNNANKEIQPVSNQHVLRDLPLHMNTTSPDEHDFERYAERDDSQGMLSDLISNPCDAALELPISTSELEQLANSVQAVEESALASISAPEPEPPIENSVCREQLLSHIQHCQALIDARLDSIEAQVAELESQDPTVEGDDTADSFPRTKQTIKMLMRDLDTLEELGIIT